MPAGSILVVGGTGDVGMRLARQLDARVPGRVLLGCRDLKKAKEFPARKLDLADLKSLDAALDGVDLVVACVREKEPHLLCAAIHRGLAYTTIAPPWMPVAETEPLHSEAVRTGARAVLAAGLQPGISSVLVRAAANQLPSVESVETALLLSVGDSYGPDALAYLFDELEEPYAVTVGGEERTVMAFEHARRVQFPAPVGERRAWNMPFRDQLYYPSTLGVKTAIARLSLDPPWMGTAVADLLKVGLRRWVHGGSRLRVLRMLARFQRRYAGHDAFALEVEVRGGGKVARATMHGRCQAEATAAGAAAIAEALWAREVAAPGIYLAEQVIEPKAFCTRLAEAGFQPMVEPVRDLPAEAAAAAAWA